MTISKRAVRQLARPNFFTATALAATVASAAMLVGFAQSAQAAAVAVPLGTAQSFSVLAGAGITNTGATTLSGDMGTYATTTLGGPTAPLVGGTNHGGDAVTQGAKSDLVTAYNVAASEGPTSPITDDLGGETLTRGVYNSASSMGLTGKLTLDAQGDPGAVFVFQVGSALTTASASSIELINSANPCNVFWQVGSSATLGTTSTFVGTLMARQSVSLTTDATVQGRILARNGSVTMDTNTITTSACATKDEATSQIADVPKGSVDTGSGEVVTHRIPGGLLAIIAVMGIGGTVSVLALRRRTS